MRCCATCRGHRLPRWHRSRIPANGAAPRGGPVSEGKSAGVGRAGGLRRGRCKYVHVSSVAASMRLTPLRSPPARPRTVSVCVHHGKEREDQKRKRIASLCIHAWRGSTVSTKVGTYPQSQVTHRHRETIGGGAGGGGGGGPPPPRPPPRPPPPPPGGFTGVPPPPPPPRPTLSNPEPLWLWLWLWLWPLQVQGCKPCKATTSPSLQSPAGRGSPATAAASATPGSSHHAGPAAAATPATAPPRCNRARPRAARR